jgi:hypothetical protein
VTAVEPGPAGIRAADLKRARIQVFDIRAARTRAAGTYPGGIVAVTRGLAPVDQNSYCFAVGSKR